jgi:hypothetical protein
MSKATSSLVCAALLASLSACGGEGGGDNNNGSIGRINCAGLTGGTAAAGASCAGGTCSQTFTDAAADNDLNTYAILEMSGASGSVHIRVTAADGVTYPAGTPAAVVYGITRSGSGESLNTTETITTYLDGTPQQTGNANITNGSTNSDVAAGRRAMATTLAFDAIEVTYAQTGGTGDVEMRVYEFCTSVN